MKKFASILVVLALVLALCAPAMAEEKPVIVVGQLMQLAKTEEEINKRMDEIANSTDKAFPVFDDYALDVITYHSLNEMLMALDAGQIQIITADEPTVQYILSRNEVYQEMHPAVEQTLGYSMLFVEDSAALCDSFNTAIAAMQEDGTLDKLAETYIDGVIAGAEPEAVAFPSFEGADTITVAVTGDVPPMDYVDDAGEAAGFNTAVLAEIANRLGINVELIQVDSGARALALSSGHADVVFWTKSNADFGFQDVPAGTVASDPYYTAPSCNLVIRAE